VAEYEARKAEDKLEVIFENGRLVKDLTLAGIRGKLLGQL
jgi:nicotinamide phosphoribosyltransferase